VLVPIAVVVTSIALGAALAVAPVRGSRLIGPTRTFAITASLAVILACLLPEAFRLLGAWALLLFVLGFIAAGALDRLAERLAEGNRARSARGSAAVGLEAGYLGLLVHRVGDGMALSAVSGSPHAGHPRLVVLAALAAHSIPVAALVTMAFDAARGRRVALLRAAGLAAAGVIGILAARAVPFESVRHAEGYVAALVAGLLLRVVVHDTGALVPPRAAGRGLNLAAAVVGISVGVLAGFLH